MEVLTILGIILVVVGLLGTVLPVLPGVPLSYGGILLIYFSDRTNFSTQFLIFWGVVTVVVSLLDYYVPVWGTKKFGGTKYGTWGSFLGIIVGLFFAPWGIILGPFAGAVLGEILAGKKTQHALKAGFGVFVGLFFNTILKLIAAGFMLFYAVEAVIK